MLYFRSTFPKPPHTLISFKLCRVCTYPRDFFGTLNRPRECSDSSFRVPLPAFPSPFLDKQEEEQVAGEEVCRIGVMAHKQYTLWRQKVGCFWGCVCRGFVLMQPKPSDACNLTVNVTRIGHYRQTLVRVTVRCNSMTVLKKHYGQNVLIWRKD